MRGLTIPAQSSGVSPLVVGPTVMGFGTSAHDVAVSVGAVLNGQTDIAIGSVVGSNAFNIRGCLCRSSLVSGDSGLTMAASLLTFDIWAMLAVALACLPVSMSGCEIARRDGGAFFADSLRGLPAISAAMASFVIPITVITLVVVLLRKPQTTHPSP